MRAPPDDEVATLRVPPHSTEAEQSVLGGLLLENAAFDVVSEVLRSADFYRFEHRLIWDALAGLIGASRPADVITVGAALDAARQLEDVGGLQYLNALAQSVPSASNARAYANIVRERALARRAIAVSDELATAAFAMRTADDLRAAMDRAALLLLQMQEGVQEDQPREIGELLPGWIEALEARARGELDAVATGLEDLDRALAGGMNPGDLIVLGARPSMGKSALSLTIARNVARRGPVLIFSMEDSDTMLVSRQVAATGKVNLADIRMPDRAPRAMWQGVSEGVEALRATPIYIDDKPALRQQDVRRKALQVKRRAKGLKLVIVDYLQLMEGEGDNRHQQIGGIAAGMKRMAKELRCPVLLLSQLSREAEKTDAPPRLDHLRESGGIEEAADIVWLLWREARRKPRPDNKHKAQIELAKNKNGPTDTVHLFFDGATQRFENEVWEYGHGA